MKVPAHSFAVPTRRSGICATAASSCWGGVVRSCIGVSITPGETAFTRMRSGANSFASARVKVATKSLRARVERRPASAAGARRHRADIDDHPASALAHQGDGSAASREDGLDIRGDLLIEKLIRGLLDAIARNEVARVVDEDVQAAEGLSGFANEALGDAAFCKVALEQHGPATCLLDIAGNCRRLASASPIMDRDMSAATTERASDRRADPAARARNEARLLLQIGWKRHLRSSK